jgi:hypothetical protein
VQGTEPEVSAVRTALYRGDRQAALAFARAALGASNGRRRPRVFGRPVFIFGEARDVGEGEQAQRDHVVGLTCASRFETRRERRVRRLPTAQGQPRVPPHAFQPREVTLDLVVTRRRAGNRIREGERLLGSAFQHQALGPVGIGLLGVAVEAGGGVFATLLPGARRDSSAA